MDSEVSKPVPAKNTSSLLTLMLKESMAPQQKDLGLSRYPTMAPPLAKFQSTSASRGNTLWKGYPPKLAPKLDLEDPYIPPTAGLVDAEELVNSYNSQLNELGSRMKDTYEARQSLYINSPAHPQFELLSSYQQTYSSGAFNSRKGFYAWEHAIKLQANLEPGRQAILKQDRILVDKILLDYQAHTNLKTYEANISEAKAVARTRAEEGQKHANKLSKVDRNVKRMFGFHLDGCPSRKVLSSSQADTHPAPPNPPHIPDWFYILHSKSEPFLAAGDVTIIFLTLLQLIDKLQKEVECWNQLNGKRGWDKNWHEPNMKWPHEFQRLKGGWWKCRSGPEAPDVERQCSLCNFKPKKAAQQPSLAKSGEKLDAIMKSITATMKEVAKEDQAVVRQRRLQEEARETDNSQLPYQIPIRQPIDESGYRANYSLLRGHEDMPR
ncbi:hypothetical protein F4818DRAFT_42433 [Hypoxylon cercidicola]|nr:hypothetical protein F4818DRAFT_42433 [Hypoxylon cercidicola]